MAFLLSLLFCFTLSDTFCTLISVNWSSMLRSPGGWGLGISAIVHLFMWFVTFLPSANTWQSIINVKTTWGREGLLFLSKHLFPPWKSRFAASNRQINLWLTISILFLLWDISLFKIYNVSFQGANSRRPKNHWCGIKFWGTFLLNNYLVFCLGNRSAIFRALKIEQKQWRKHGLGHPDNGIRINIWPFFTSRS